MLDPARIYAVMFENPQPVQNAQTNQWDQQPVKLHIYLDDQRTDDPAVSPSVTLNEAMARSVWHMIVVAGQIPHLTGMGQVAFDASKLVKIPLRNDPLAT